MATLNNGGRFRARASAYWRLGRFDRPVGTWLLLWPTLWALWLSAQGVPDLPRLLVFVVGTFLMRAAGCVLNDLADRKFDGYVKRTAQRVLATGELSVAGAVVYALVLLAASASLLFFLNDLAKQFALVAAFLAAAYPFFKRFFPYPQVVLGMAFGFGIPMAFADTLGEVPPIGWWLWILNLAWVVAYDTAYAMVDRDDDLRLGLKSSAISLGQHDWTAVVMLQMVFLAGMAGLTWFFPLGAGYLIFCAIACFYGVFLARRLRSRTREDSLYVFLKSHWIGALLWLGMVVGLARW
ncbi:MAG: 4-hydroxybenzoate octaprenyltransferase [Burkholderiaceae bacterium]